MNTRDMTDIETNFITEARPSLHSRLINNYVRIASKLRLEVMRSSENLSDNVIHNN